MTAPSQNSDLLQINDRTFRPYIRRDEIDEMVRSVARRINHDFAGKEVILLVILKGAIVFASDLMRHLSMSVTVETLRASSYHNNTRSMGTVILEEVAPDIEGRHVVIVEDIVDSGTTIRELIKHLAGFQPASVSVAALLSKPDVHHGRIQIDYVGREIAPDFVVGYGMDYAGQGRHLDAVWVVDDEENNLDT